MSTPAPFPWPTTSSPSWLDRLWQSTRAFWQKIRADKLHRWLEWGGLGLGAGGLIIALIAWRSLTSQLHQWSSQDSIEESSDSPLKVLPSASATVSATTNSGNPQTAVTVYVTGAVKKPGVYHLSGTSLFMDAIMAAGGFSSAVWQDYLDQFINLAQPLVDHQKIWIPKLDQQALFLSSDTGQSESQTELTHDNLVISPTQTLSSDTTTTTDSLISINSATLKELMTLSGIGQKRAEDIIANRPYQSLPELTTKAKISASIYEQIEAQLKL